MTDPFLISDDRLRSLSATRQGRVSIAGYNYQAAYAIARLASMCVREPVLDLKDWPHLMRYDWGEDLDEACDDGTVRFTQSKRIDTIGQPASLAEVLTGFVPKWLWVQEPERSRLRFRLVCSDPRFAMGGSSLDSLEANVRQHFLNRLNTPASVNSDRAEWINDAASIGPEVLFEAIWNQFDCLYLPAEVVDSEPAGPRLAAEKEALRVLLERGRIDAEAFAQKQVLGRLRRLIHDNLISFDPTNESVSPSLNHSPRRLDRADVNAAIDPWRPTTQRQSVFQLVDRTFLSEQRELEREQYVARQPDWSDVAHGCDEIIKFIERDQTEALEASVLEKVVARIGRRGKLPTLFVVGAPGDGKTTITRRVAARLVDAGVLLIADTGVGLQEPPGEPDEYVQAIERLQGFGRPVVMLLDDPLYAESPWLNVLKKLNRPGLLLGVLAASPQFLLDEHKSQLRACDLWTFEMARTSQTERDSLAAIYGRAASPKTEEDFLVVAMEMAAGVPFRDIIERLWLTLADGRDLSSARSLSDLPWQTRAYLFVCFFSRAYEACPEPLLLKLLEITGGISDTSDVAIELQRMKHFAGWRIFRIGQPTRAYRSAQRVFASRRDKRAWAAMDYEGAPISAAHTVIARQAWQQRPLIWCDVGEEIIQTSTSVPLVIRDVSSLAVRLASKPLADSTSGANDTTFAKRLIERWRDDSSVETRHLSRLVFTFSKLGHANRVRVLRETLIQRATRDSQGWLAALRLFFLQERVVKKLSFPRELDIQSILRSADFSVATWEATHFGQLLEPDQPLRGEFVSRLFEAFDGKLSWNLDSKLLTYLLTIATPEQWGERFPLITAWLELHPEDASVRTRYLSFLLKLPAEFSALRAEAARQTARWLKDHPEDNFLRPKYLSFLLRLPAEFSDLRSDAALQTAKWLENHPEDNVVRTQYLPFLLKLHAEFSDLRSAALQTTKWLEEHTEDSIVRTQYLSFLLKLPAEFSDLREAAARQTAKWVKNHNTDMNVRTQYLIFLSEMEPVGYWQRLASFALHDAVQLVLRSGYLKRHVSLITSVPSLHLALLRSLKLNDSEVVRRVLLRSHKVVGEWCLRNSSLGIQAEVPLP